MPPGPAARTKVDNRWAMILKISIMHVTMTGYRVVRKPALDAPEPVELEFARDRMLRTGELASVVIGCRRFISNAAIAALIS
jgi:hypothetical protein